jgi:hypothetical protein
MDCRAGRHCEEQSDVAIAMTRWVRNDGISGGDGYGGAIACQLTFTISLIATCAYFVWATGLFDFEE